MNEIKFYICIIFSYIILLFIFCSNFHFCSLFEFNALPLKHHWTCGAAPGPSQSLRCDKPDLQNVLHSNACLRLTYSDAIVSQVLDELGLTMSDELSSKEPPLYFHSLSSVVFFWTFAITLRVHRSPASGRGSHSGAWSKEGGGPGRADGCRCRSGGPTAEPTERMSAAAVGQVHCGIGPPYKHTQRLFSFYFFFCNRWIAAFSLKMVCVETVFQFEVLSFIVCVIILLKMEGKKKHLQRSWSCCSHRHFCDSFKVPLEEKQYV